MFSRVNVQCLLTLNIQKRAVDSNLVCLFKNRWSQCPRYRICNTPSTSMPMPGRSSRSRRRWSTSWRSTPCPTASTATGRAATAATGWPDIGVSLQPIYFNGSFFPIRGELSSVAGNQSQLGPWQRVQPLPERWKHRQLLLPLHTQQAPGSSSSLKLQWQSILLAFNINMNKD